MTARWPDPGQFEQAFTDADALSTADRVVTLRYLLSVLAERRGMTGTFMAKPFSDRTGRACLALSSINGAGEVTPVRRAPWCARCSPESGYTKASVPMGRLTRPLRGQPLGEVPDALAVELDRWGRLGGGSQVSPDRGQQVVETDRHVAGLSDEGALCLPSTSTVLQVSPLVGRLARLGCTRIGFPGIFGERNSKALFRAANRRWRMSESGWVIG